jgi:hypothetical protein
MVNNFHVHQTDLAYVLIDHTIAPERRLSSSAKENWRFALNATIPGMRRY